MKKLLALLIVAVMAFSFAACDNKKPVQSGKNPAPPSDVQSGDTNTPPPADENSQADTQNNSGVDSTPENNQQSSGASGCIHSFAVPTCTEPRTCKFCDVTEGEALGHRIAEATCTLPKRCTRCGITYGEALGHDYTEATCLMASTCTRCEAVKGIPLNHEIDAKTAACVNCGTVDDGYVEPVFTKMCTPIFFCSNVDGKTVPKADTEKLGLNFEDPKKISPTFVCEFLLCYYDLSDFRASRGYLVPIKDMQKIAKSIFGCEYDFSKLPATFEGKICTIIHNKADKTILLRKGANKTNNQTAYVRHVKVAENTYAINVDYTIKKLETAENPPQGVTNIDWYYTGKTGGVFGTDLEYAQVLEKYTLNVKFEDGVWKILSLIKQ